MPDAKTTKEAAAGYMMEPHDPRDSISSQALAPSPSSRAAVKPPPETTGKSRHKIQEFAIFAGLFRGEKERERQRVRERGGTYTHIGS